MARAPRATVPKTTGAGISRLSYQQGYAKGNRGSAAAGGAVPGVQGGSQSITDESLRRGGRAKFEKGDGDINVSYGDTLPIGDLTDVKAAAQSKPQSDNFLKSKARPKAISVGDRGRSGYAKK